MVVKNVQKCPSSTEKFITLPQYFIAQWFLCKPPIFNGKNVCNCCTDCIYVFLTILRITVIICVSCIAG
jgi:hypothetical protein